MNSEFAALAVAELLVVIFIIMIAAIIVQSEPIARAVMDFFS